MYILIGGSNSLKINYKFYIFRSYGKYKFYRRGVSIIEIIFYICSGLVIDVFRIVTPEVTAGKTKSLRNGRKMKDEVLFTPQFEFLYTLLGVVSFMYADGEGKGIERSNLLKGFAEGELPMVRTSLALLTDYGILSESGGLLHLRKKFYELSMWDLLVMCAPCFKDCDGRPGHDFPGFMRSEKVWKNLVENSTG